MPVFDFAQDRLEILSDRQPAIACNRDRRRRHVVGEFCASPGLAGRLEIDDHLVLRVHADMYSNEHTSTKYFSNCRWGLTSTVRAALGKTG